MNTQPSMNPATIENIRVVEFQTLANPSGNLVVVESDRSLPFPIKRLFYVHGVPAGETRGRHAHRKCQQMISCVSGKCEVIVDDGTNRKALTLSTPNQAIYLPPLVWAEQKYCVENTVILVLTDQYYDESDYIRDYPEFIQIRKNRIAIP